MLENLKLEKNRSTKSGRVTMQDVAREAEVSQSTVSFVLNNNKDVHIAEETRNRVFEVVKRLLPAAGRALSHTVFPVI